MRRILFIIAILCTLAAAAQSAKPIKWRISVRMTSATTGEATLRAIVADGWHLYGTSIPDGGPRATAITTAGSTGVTFTGNARASLAPARVHDPVFDMDLSWWDANVSFTLPFEVTGGDPVIKLTVSYMGCNDETCLPPSTETLTYTVKK